MNPVSPEKAHAIIALCARCKRETLPTLKGPSWHRDVLRAAAKGMARPTDEKAERIKARKERKSHRAEVKASGIVAFVKARLTGIALAPVSDECLECRALQDSRRAA